jgi:hypothetical protein
VKVAHFVFSVSCGILVGGFMFSFAGVRFDVGTRCFSVSLV